MTPNQMAKKVGCDPSHIRRLIREGKLKATYTETPGGYYYNITEATARKYQASLSATGGWTRGKPRKEN